MQYFYTGISSKYIGIGCTIEYKYIRELKQAKFLSHGWKLEANISRARKVISKNFQINHLYKWKDI